MKKFGFTLAEVLLSLSLVGIVAAMASPMISNIIPDKNKVLVLKAYKNLTTVNAELLNNLGLYWSSEDNSCIAFECDETPVIPEYATNMYSGSSKYANLLSAHMQIQGSPSDKFTTIDGLYWEVDGIRAVTIDVNGPNEGNDCVYNKNTCKKPDKFVFELDRYGNVRAGDALTEQYLKNKYKLNDRRNDFKAIK